MVVGLGRQSRPDAPWLLLATGHSDDVVASEVRATPGELAVLRANPEYLVIEAGAPLPSYLDIEPLRRSTYQLHLVLPVMLRGQVGGVIALAYARRPAHTEESLQQARQLADQMAVALSNAGLLEQIESLRRGALTALARTIDAKSPWTAGHSERVTTFSLAIARHLGLSDEDRDRIYRGGLLHDIGKIGVPAEVLDKAGRLTAPEWDQMKAHVTIGARILTPIEAYGDVIPIVLYHHERWDGTGYPEGLSREGIPFDARLLSVADVFDAVTSDRPYRAGWSFERAVEHIRELAGVQFDPVAVEAFLTLAASGQLPFPRATGAASAAGVAAAAPSAIG
jgi:putative nucleotidyltransferase with HDIG domain